MFNPNEQFLDSSSIPGLKKYAVKTFAWMTLGLLVTTVVAFAIYSSNLVYYLFESGFIPLILLVAQLGVAIALAARLMKMSVAGTKFLFLIYSALTGITFSVLGLVYLPGTLAAAFLITTVYFGSLTVIGYTTKMNLLRFGPILFAGLLSLIIVEIIFMLMGADTSTMAFSVVGLLIFTGLTAYDVQRLKALYLSYEGDIEMQNRLSIYSAFQLYLDFINIFLYVLRFLDKD